MTIYSHTCIDRTPYTYLIGWSHLNKWYYGCRYGKNCHPSDLWKTYFTSSKVVLRFRQENGEPDIITVRKVFSNQLSAKKLEDRVLLSIKNRDNWLNSRFGSFKGIVITDELRKSMSDNHYDISGMNNPNYGGKITSRPEVREKKRLKKLGTKRSIESRLKQSASSIGHTKSSVDNYVISANNREILKCPHCDRHFKGPGCLGRHIQVKHSQI